MQKELPTIGSAWNADESCEKRPFSLNLNVSNPLAQRLWHSAATAAEHLLGLNELNEIYLRISRRTGPSYSSRALEELRISYRCAEADLQRIPRSGPLIVVANHPFGGVEGLILMDLLSRARPDTKVMANYLLHRIPELRETLVAVDPFGSRRAAVDNLHPMRAAVRWIEAGGVLALFPAGTVAHFHGRIRRVTDPHWSNAVALLARKTKAPVLPLFFEGRNGNAFQIAGMIHPRLRTALLPRQLLRQRGREFEVRIGAAIGSRRLCSMDDDGEMTTYIRQRCFMLRHRITSAQPARHTMPAQETIVRPVASQLLLQDVEQLPASSRLAENGDLAVYFAQAGQIPNVMREIGRLREITYRATGEGTGKSIDLDCFDQWYGHLFVWNRVASEIVGAYRLGQTDQILEAHGVQGLYTASLFSFNRTLLDRLGPSLEMGRSFVRAEYQKSYSPLLLLWKGIGGFVVQQPRYRMLFGPVSISNDYQTISKHLMVQFLRECHGRSDLSQLVRARNPFHSRLRNDDCPDANAALTARQDDDLDDLVCGIESDGKGVPVLVRQYLKLGARFLAYNIDRDFNNALDALMVVDLAQTERRVLDRYMTREGAERFLAQHQTCAAEAITADAN